MTVSLKPLSEQVMVITGASSGIGLATALLAAERGAAVVLTARSGETLANVAKQVRAAGGRAIHVVADVADRGQLQAVADEAIGTFGRIDTWVNDAGVSIYGRLDEVAEDDSRRLFDVNFWGIVNGSLITLPYLKRSGGALINVGSEVSDAFIPLQGMYSASKHAVKGFTDALRVEVLEIDKAPVSITLIQPTAVDTPCPQHARNYMSEEPKLPSPQIDLRRVAEAILDAATHPRRAVKVGAVSKINTFVAKFAPRLADKISARQLERQQYDEPPRDPEGTLYKPGEEGRVTGRGGAVTGNGQPRSSPSR
ncbi:MAG: SDR family oxidoreductase [Myxococcales bacterium]|nr:SDR family oxidoreductase [Myxococcales bacterium]